MDYTLYKYRTYRGVISAGFGLYFSHFRLFFKASWLMALLFAIVFATLEMLLAVQLPAITATIMKQTLVQQAPLQMEAAQQYLMTIGGIFLLILLWVIVDAMTYGTIINKLKEHHDTSTMMIPKRWFAVSRRMMGRTLKGYLFTIFVMLLPALIIAGIVALLVRFSGFATYTLMMTIVLLTMAVILLCLPLVFVFMKYVLNQENSYFSQFFKAFTIGMRHWGQIFTVGLIGGLLVGIIIGLCYMPATILSQAHFASQEGFLNGDPLGMPDYITILSVSTYFLTGFVLVYLYMPMLMIAYYVYGSIETYEQEKNMIKI